MDNQGRVTQSEHHAALDRRDATIKALQNDIDSARQGYVARGECLARVQAEAKAIADALGERGCWAWATTDEHEPRAPKCWTDGVCWGSNDDGVPSRQPRHWRFKP